MSNSESLMKNLVIPFLLGGSIIAGVKYTATKLHNPALAAILGGLPIGLMSIYFVSTSEASSYAYNYFYVTLILLMSIMLFYVLYTHGNLSKNIAWGITMVCWAVLILSRYLYAQHFKNKTT